MSSVRYEMQIKTDGYGWEYFDDKKNVKDLNCFGYYRKLYSQGKTATDARIVKIETIKTVIENT